jgi:AcrR family transcriptional regulator
VVDEKPSPPRRRGARSPKGENAYPDADADLAAGRKPASESTALSRDKVVSAAVAFIDEQGLPGLTMRKLGERLGVEAMSLYRYVPGREDLLDAVVEHVMAGMAQDAEVFEAPRHGWQDFLQRMAHGVRRLALAHPKVFPLVASRPLEAPWLRPPLRSLEWVERFLDGLIGEGFSEDNAVGAYRAFSSFLLGHLLLEVSTHGADVGPLDVVEEDQHDAGLARYPTVQRLQAALSEDHAAVEFEDALEELLRRLDLIRNDHL